MEKKREKGFAHRVFGQIQTKRNVCENFDVQRKDSVWCCRKHNCRKTAFTLAEVLITLAVIGIVAAAAIGIFLPKIHSQIRAHQIAVAETKFTKAMEQMALNNAIGPYYESTQEFVDELQNYLKIAKVCDNEHLEDCFGYQKIKLGENEEFDVADISDGAVFGMPKNETDSDFTGNTAGIVTIDGTGMILAWNKLCPILEPKVYAWGGNTNETTSCVAMVMDINLDKNPNTLNKDVSLFRAQKVGKVCGMEFKVDGKKYCWGTPFLPNKPVYSQECNKIKDELGVKECITYQTFKGDRWLSAVKECGGTQNMLNSEQQVALAKYLYGRDVDDNGPTADASTYGLALNSDALFKVSPILSSSYTSESYFYLWTGIEYDADDAWYRFYCHTQVIYGRWGSRTRDYIYAICTNP